MTLNLAVSRSRPSVPYGANLFSFCFLYCCAVVFFWCLNFWHFANVSSVSDAVTDSLLWQCLTVPSLVKNPLICFLCCSLHETRTIFLNPFISEASKRVSSLFLSVQLSQPYVATSHTSAFISRIFVEIGMLWLFHIFCTDAEMPRLPAPVYLVRNSVVHLPSSVTRDPRYGNVSTCSCTFWMSMRHALPSLAITLVLSTLMSRLYLQLTRSMRSISSCSSASKVANRMMSSAKWRFVTIRLQFPPICSPPWNPSRVCLITISARMLNKDGERT